MNYVIEIPFFFLHFQMTPATSYAGSANGTAVVSVVVPGSAENQLLAENYLLVESENNPDLLKQLGNSKSTNHSILTNSAGPIIVQNDEIRLTLLNKEVIPLRRNTERDSQNRSSPPPPLIPKRSTSYDFFR